MSRLAAIPHIFVGHVTNEHAHTGCTVVLCPDGAAGGVDVRGAAPGTRETDLLRPGNLVEQVHAVLLAGGSAFGLAAAEGVVKWLYERNIGVVTGVANVPIVPAAVLFDLGVGEVAWPDAAMGYAACEAAQTDAALWGRVGAGAGATVGKILGLQAASPGGIGVASITLPDGISVTAVIAVNALGHVINPQTNQIIAGPQLKDGSFGDSVELLLRGMPQSPFGMSTNTTIGCIVTTAHLDKASCNRVASMAHDGLARTIRPVHTQYDGDTLFALSAPLPTEVPSSPYSNITLIGVAAAEVVAQAVIHAVQTAR